MLPYVGKTNRITKANKQHARRSAGAGEIKEINMSDLIDRQAAIDALYHVDEYNGRSVEAIRKLPPAQPEIIRCKDCKHWIPYDWMFSEVWQSRNINDYPEDEIGCNYCDVAMKANDFCSRGERREDG